MSDPVLKTLPHSPQQDATTLVLQRLERANALDAELVEALIDEIARIQDAESGRPTVILRSAHRAFSAGFDLGRLDEQSAGDLLLRFVRIETLLQRVRSGPVSTMAVVEGAAYGAGADLALACGWRIGTPSSKFRFPGFRFGVALGTRHLALMVGSQQARRILLENRLVGAQEALELGLLTHLVAPEDVDDLISDLLTQMRDLPPGAAARIHGMTRTATEDADMAALAMSLAEPGLKHRIAAYIDAGRQ